MEDTSTQSWNQIAEDWATHADTNDYRNLFLIPQTLALLGDVNGRRILDLGCGEGGYSRILATQKAEVTGIDGSERLIEITKQRAQNEGLNITFQCANANSLRDIGNEYFDLVMASMSLMDVQDYQGTIAEINRVLKRNRELFMSITHPCFTGHGSRWWRDADGTLVHYAVENYGTKETWEEFITDQFSQPVMFRHMRLEDFISPLLQLGFKLILFQEPSPSPEQIQQSDRLKRLKQIPLFLFMKWQK